MRKVPCKCNIASVPVYRVQLVEDGGLIAKPTIDHVEDAAGILFVLISLEEREHFVILMLNAKNEVIGVHTVSIGTLTYTAVMHREVFKAAILANAASIVLGHSHPSGDPTSAREDKEVTKDLQEEGRLLDIPVLDHVIVGERENSLQ